MNILVVRNQKEIEYAYEKLAAAPEIGCDTETSSLSPRTGKLFSIQFSNGDFNVLVPLSEGVAPGKLAELLEDPLITKIFHNAKFDVDYLSANHFRVRNIYDSMLAEKVLTKGANQSVSLAETLYRYFAVDLEKSHRNTFTKNWNGIWTGELVDYALQDVFYLPQLKTEQQLWLRRLGLTEDYAKQMQRVFGNVR